MLANVLRLGFGGADTPAKALGAGMHAHNGRPAQHFCGMLLFSGVSVLGIGQPTCLTG